MGRSAVIQKEETAPLSCHLEIYKTQKVAKLLLYTLLCLYTLLINFLLCLTVTINDLEWPSRLCSLHHLICRGLPYCCCWPPPVAIWLSICRLPTIVGSRHILNQSINRHEFQVTVTTSRTTGLTLITLDRLDKLILAIVPFLSPVRDSGFRNNLPDCHYIWDSWI